MENVGKFQEALQKKKKSDRNLFILSRKAREKNLCYCCFQGQFVVERKKVLYTLLLLVLSASQKE